MPDNKQAARRVSAWPSNGRGQSVLLQRRPRSHLQAMRSRSSKRALFPTTLGTLATWTLLSGVYLDDQFTRRGSRVSLALLLFAVLVLLVIALVIWGHRLP